MSNVSARILNLRENRFFSGLLSLSVSRLDLIQTEKLKSHINKLYSLVYFTSGQNDE